MSNAKAYLPWIDELKGLAIAGIVAFHIFQNYPSDTLFIELGDSIGRKVGFAAVSLFFVVAGFNTSYSLANRDFFDTPETPQNWRTWLQRRLVRLYPTYWLAIALSLLLYLVAGQINPKLNAGNLLLIALGFPGYERFKLLNPGLWFFSVILQYYLIAPLLLTLMRRRPLVILPFGLAVAIAIDLTCWQLNRELPLYSFLAMLNFIGSYFFEVCLGLYWGTIYAKYGKFRRIDGLASLALFGIGIAAYQLSRTDLLYMLGLNIIVTPLLFCVCYYALVMAKHWGQNSLALLSRFLGIAGRSSYQVYLIHQPLLFVWLPIWGQVSPKSSSAMLSLGLLLAAFMVVLYVFLFLKIEAWLSQIRSLIFS